jgi:hypothetical protein
MTKQERDLLREALAYAMHHATTDDSVTPDMYGGWDVLSDTFDDVSEQDGTLHRG